MTTALDQSLCFCKHPYTCENVTEHILNGKVSELVFKITEFDQRQQRPLMYFVCGNHYNVLVDTGCGAGDLRDYLGVQFGHQLDLRELVVVNTSNRYCHVGGNCYFATDRGHVAQGVKDLVASNYMPSYTLNADETLAWLESSSYTTFVPYKPTLWVGDRHVIKLGNDPDNYVLLMQTPGPTPDSLCVWYPRDRRLFVGDFLHRWKPLLAVSDYSNLHQYESSARRLLAFVRSQPDPETVRLSCGHHDDNANVLPLLDYFVHMLSEINRGRAKGKPVSCGYEGLLYESRDYSIKLLVGMVSPVARAKYDALQQRMAAIQSQQAVYASSQLGESLVDRDNVDDLVSRLGLEDDVLVAPGDSASILAGQLKRQLSTAHIPEVTSQQSKKSSKSKKSKKSSHSATKKDQDPKVAQEAMDEKEKQTVIPESESEKPGPSKTHQEVKTGERIVNGVNQDTTTESAIS